MIDVLCKRTDVGRAKQGCLSVCVQGLCKDAKPTKHTQTLAIRKASGIVRFLKGWCGAKGWCGNPSGSRPNFFGRRHLTFDKRCEFSAEQGTIVLLRGLWGWRGSMQLRQSLRLDGRKVCNIKRADISQVGRNKATVCVVPSSHLPLTREARVLAIFEG